MIRWYTFNWLSRGWRCISLDCMHFEMAPWEHHHDLDLYPSYFLVPRHPESRIFGKTVVHATWHRPSCHSQEQRNCYLLFEQPSSGHVHTTPCVSSYLWFASHDLLAFTKSTHCHFSHRSEGTNASSSASSYHRSSSPSHDFLSVTKPTPHETSLGISPLAST